MDWQRQGAMRLYALPVGDSRQSGTSIEHDSAVRISAFTEQPGPVRGIAVTYAEAREKMFHHDGSSVEEQRLMAAGHRFDQHHAFDARHRTLTQPVPLRLKEPEALKKSRRRSTS
jgi:hypothetical protein